jgi:predicted transcriptional regulator
VTVTKLSISLDDELARRLRDEADIEDVSVSALVADCVKDRLRHLALVRAVLAYEEEHGAFTDEELEAISRQMGD